MWATVNDRKEPRWKSCADLVSIYSPLYQPQVAISWVSSESCNSAASVSMTSVLMVWMSLSADMSVIGHYSIGHINKGNVGQHYLQSVVNWFKTIVES